MDEQNPILRTFGKPRVLLAVIHYGAAPHDAVDIAVENGADGVFLIDQRVPERLVLELARAMARRHPDLWIGLNLLERGAYGPRAVLEFLRQEGLVKRPAEGPGGVRGLWCDCAGIECGANGRPVVTRDASDFAKARLPEEVLYFGGVAFKHQRPVPDSSLAAIGAACAGFVDVVTTSGPATGVAAPPAKVRGLCAAMRGCDALALASGVTEENVGDYPDVAAFLVGTGIEIEFGVLDPKRVRALADRIHRSL